MAKQVKPFETQLCLGYMVKCHIDDIGTEDEGIVYFDSPPKVGDKAILSDGKEWTVTHKSNELMEIVMELL